MFNKTPNAAEMSDFLNQLGLSPENMKNNFKTEKVDP
jgi:hypothetical protein